MSQLNCLIIDDEPDNRSNLRFFLEEYCPDVYISGEADSVHSGYKAITQFQPNLVFLDTQMRDGSGFELLEAFENIGLQAIFVTAHDQYAIKAVKANALDYLLKPIDILELCLSVKKARQRLQEKLQTPDKNQQHAKAINRLPIHTSEQLLIVEIDQIIRLEGDNNYTRIFLENGDVHLVSKTLKVFEDKLINYNFMRVHQSYIINLDHVKSYCKKEGGYLVMSDNSNIGIARQRKDKVLKKLCEEA